MKWHNNGQGESINPEFGQLLLLVGIYLNNLQMVETACDHYPEKTVEIVTLLRGHVIS